LFVVQLNDITFVSGPRKSGWTSGPDTSSARNYEALKSATQGDVVTFGLNITPTNTLAAKLITWSSATPSADNLTATVDATKVGSNYVTASNTCGGSTGPYTAWIFWAQFSNYNTTTAFDPGDPLAFTNPVVPHTLPTPTNAGPFDMTYGGQFGPLIDQFGAKVEITAALQPAGIGSIVTNGFVISQFLQNELFDNGLGGLSATNNPPGTYQGYRPDGALPQTNIGDRIFAIDDPGQAVSIPANGYGGNFVLFYDYVTVAGTTNIASDVGNWFYEYKVEYTGSSKWLIPNPASNGFPPLPTNFFGY
jgi:hypothetical protein